MAANIATPRAARGVELVDDELLGKSSIVVGLGCNNPKTIIAIIGISLQIVATVWIRPLALLSSKFNPVTVVAAHALTSIEYFFLYQKDLEIVLKK